MTSAIKSQKDKPQISGPKLAPRATAASAARAARNATNRNVNPPPSKRVSPTRSLPPPKPKCPRTGPVQKTTSKTDVKAHQLEPDDDARDTILIISETSEERIMIQDEYTTEETISELKAEIIPVQDNKKTEFTSRIPVTIAQTAFVSRPETPKSVGSRPQTPNSRPTTPGTVQQASLHGSRPNTPQRPLARPRTPSSISSPPPVTTDTPSSVTDTVSSNKEVVEDSNATYIAKQLLYNNMKMELDLKQHAVLEVYQSLRAMRDRITIEGGSGGGEAVQELVMFNVADWATEEVTQLCQEITKTENASELMNITLAIDDGVLTELDANIMDVSSRFADLCLQAFTARQELIDWVKELIESNETGDGEPLERIARYNTQGLQLCEALRELKNRSNFAVDTATQLSKRTCQERNALIRAGETLVRELARLKHDLEDRNELLNEMKAVNAENDTAKELEELRRELEEEKTSKSTLKDKLSTAESQLRQARIRINKMDRQLRETEASITSLTSTVKTLEDQSRQREVHLEARARKLKESLKTGEVASSQLVQQRDILQEQVQSLKEEIEKLTSQHDLTVKGLTNEIKELKNALEQQEQETNRVTELKQIAESTALETQNNLDELKNKIASLENSKSNPELPTEREMDLWAELQAVKETLRMTEDEMTACMRDKNRFLENFTKLAESDNKIGLQQKLAAELLSKEEIFSKMQSQIRELTKNIKLNEQKVVQYEQYVRNLQAHNRAVANCQEAPNGISYQDLQQEIMNLRMGLLEAVHRNDELSEILVQKEQQIEQQEKTSRAQARVIKVREELINMLKNKETEQSRELNALQQDLERRMRIVEDVNKQIAAKAEEIQELFTTLENKQQQIHRLEKIVLALEEQQRRAQAQRTRHEEKIAALEHELAAGGNRKFLFF